MGEWEQDKELPMRVEKDKLNYLGMWITRTELGFEKENLIPTIAKLEKDVKHWSKLPLSLSARAAMLKMIATFIYNAKLPI